MKFPIRITDWLELKAFHKTVRGQPVLVRTKRRWFKAVLVFGKLLFKWEVQKQ